MDFNNSRSNSKNFDSRGIKRHEQYESVVESMPNDEFLASEIWDSGQRQGQEQRQRQRQEHRQGQWQGHRQRHRQRENSRSAQYIAVLAITFVILVILFALFWEGSQTEDLYEDVQDSELADDSRANFPPDGRSPQQDILNELYWVEQYFLDINRFSRPGYLIEEINGVVIHFIGNPNTTAQANRNFFNNLAITEERHASSNFIICLDGTIIQCVPVDEVAYASHHRNYDTISIELCHPDETGAFTNATLRSAIRLTAWLCVQFDLTADDIIRHYDIVRADGSQKSCPLYFVENEDVWAAFKDAVTVAMEEFRVES